ncbi:hypothetical protein B7494_g2993 [Chlorociboria aeruginascens]|nr:hypothetical protein B7494_g2993 [Chlorociboria aeruginascens]
MASPMSTPKGESNWQFILHGGCAESCPDAPRQQEISRNLCSIAASVSEALSEGLGAKDAVVLAVSALEDCPLFNAGYGAALNQDGIHQLEAGIVDGHSSGYRAVGCIETTKNPILLAKALLDVGPHTMLVGRGADSMAETLGLDTVANSYFTTDLRKDYWERTVSLREQEAELLTGTVGAIVLDSRGRLAAGGSTGGATGKKNGKIGDTAVLGAGLYADAELSIVCSGAGDQILKDMVAAKVVKCYALSHDLVEAARQVLREVAVTGFSCALAAIDADGNSVIESTARLFPAVSRSSTTPTRFRLHPTTIPVFPSHTIYNDDMVLVGHHRYPWTPGHVIAILQKDTDLFSLPQEDFVELLSILSSIASRLQKYYNIGRCALITDGGSRLALLPLHGLNNDWKPVISDLKEFHETFPGYISSKDGPPMAHDRLDVICATIQTVSHLVKPYNNWFDGPNDDTNLFARIIRGEISQWRVWEDNKHVAFLTPFPNTPGFTVLVPRKHLSSDILSIDEKHYSALMVAAHKVASILKAAFKTSQCGMIFEGFEIDYAHVKLIPIHQTEPNKDSATFDNPPVVVDPLNEDYPGYLSSSDGPLAEDLEALASSSFEIRKMCRGHSL